MTSHLVRQDYAGVAVPASFGDSRLNRGRIIQLFARPDLLYALLCSIGALCSQREAAIDVISGRFVEPIVPDKFVKFSDPRLNRS